MHDDDPRDPIAEATKLRDIAFNAYCDAFEKGSSAQVTGLKFELEAAQRHLVLVRKHIDRLKQSHPAQF